MAVKAPVLRGSTFLEPAKAPVKGREIGVAAGQGNMGYGSGSVLQEGFRMGNTQKAQVIIKGLPGILFKDSGEIKLGQTGLLRGILQRDIFHIILL